MKTATEGIKLTTEIAELLKKASNEQKIMIKGILIGANALDKEKEQDKKAG